MSTLEMERGSDVLVRRPPVQSVPDHVPADLAAEHPDAATVVAGRPDRPFAVRVVDRTQRKSRAGLVLAFAACVLIAALVGGDSRTPDVVRVEATTPPAATTVTTTPTSTSTSQCPPGSPVVAMCEQPACLPAPFSPFGICRPTSNGN